MLFAAAAFISSSKHDFSISRAAVAGWASVPPPESHNSPHHTGTAITYHPEYQDFNASKAHQGLKEAAELGVEFVRTDVRWSAVFPDGITPNKYAFAWYRAFFKEVRACGLEPIIVLSSPPTSLRRLPAHEFLNRWRIYVEQVVTQLGDVCVMFQVLNEPNNPIYSIFDSATLPQAVALASHLIKGRVSGSQVLVNFIADLPNWQREAERLLIQTGTSIDVVGIDHYPGTWALSSNRSWLKCLKKLSSIDTTIQGSAWYGRKLAIMETGFATNVPWLRGLTQQKEFYLDLKQSLQNLGSLRNKILFVGFYELCDSDSNAFLNPEAHFGLLMDDCTTCKPACEVAKKISLEGE